ncbi:MAG: lipopolysaccharide biosynthesis protein [Planctomycetes bacterium]|nr:lipopolysaccharide biosynthesis protein [Planctomycetota bacterium]
MRWIDRLIGVASTLILARLLVPEDFGIVAMASLVVGLLDVLLDLGVHVALIQKRQATQALFDTAWTLRLLQNITAATLIVVAAPLAGTYFGDSRVTPVLQVMSLGLVLIGLENIGVVAFQKDMQFLRDFRFVFLKRIAGFLTTIAAAWLLRSYWALVIGALTGRLLGVVLSYSMHPMRPRISLVKFREIFAISQWLLLRSIGAYLDNNMHKILVGRRAGAGTMGAYSIADEISAMPSTELLAPLNRVLFPAFVRAKENLAELKRVFLLAQGVQVLVGIPASVGLALVAEEAVQVLLGEKWLPAVPFVQLLALVNVINAITSSGGYVMITLGRVPYVALLSWLQALVFVAGACVVWPGSEAHGIAQLRLVSVVVGLGVAIRLLLWSLPNLGLRELVASVARPVLGGGVMTVAVLFGTLPAGSTPVVALVGKIVLGSTVYGIATMALWVLWGKPEGAERYLLERVRSTLGKRQSA